MPSEHELQQSADYARQHRNRISGLCKYHRAALADNQRRLEAAETELEQAEEKLRRYRAARPQRQEA